MSIELIHGNLLQGSDDAIILANNGAAKGLEGNIARRFAQKYPDAWEEIGIITRPLSSAVSIAVRY
ncbi:MAG: hypothetical protein ABW139_06645 [Candidatus Thiodiazotropha sp. DIVDIV]